MEKVLVDKHRLTKLEDAYRETVKKDDLQVQGNYVSIYEQSSKKVDKK